MTRLGILGGTFDPPHIAHLVMADRARSQLNLSRVLVVLAGQPPHKLGRPVTPIEHRLAMPQLAMADDVWMLIQRKGDLSLERQARALENDLGA